jgi:hypothetical protein
MRIDRPAIPAAYGAERATEFVPWERVEERLRQDRVFWIVTVDPTGRPRVRPIDGLYLEGQIHVGGSPDARWVQNLARNPHVAIHLADVDDVVIAEGEGERLTEIAGDLAERLAAASNQKYPEYGLTPDTYRRWGTTVIHLRKVVAWTDITVDRPASPSTEPLSSPPS